MTWDYSFGNRSGCCVFGVDVLEEFTVVASEIEETLVQALAHFVMVLPRDEAQCQARALGGPFEVVGLCAAAVARMDRNPLPGLMVLPGDVDHRIFQVGNQLRCLLMQAAIDDRERSEEH